MPSMPFCSERTAVSGPSSGRQASAAASVSQSLTVKSTKSTGPMLEGSSVAGASTVKGSRGVWMRRPSRRIAARWRPRAMKVTGKPARASRAPNGPPTPPLPMIAKRGRSTMAPSLPLVATMARRAVAIKPPGG
jgi:hypothetical protein